MNNQAGDIPADPYLSPGYPHPDHPEDSRMFPDTPHAYHSASTWSSTQNTSLTASETTTWYDVTLATTWTATKLNDSNLKVRALAYTQGVAEEVRLDWLPVEVTYTNPTLVSDSDCTFTITNNATNAIDLDMKMADFTGGVGWNIGAPGENQCRITAYYSGQDISGGGLVLTNADQEFRDALAGSATLMWDFKFETPTSVTDGVAKSGTLTITAVVED